MAFLVSDTDYVPPLPPPIFHYVPQITFSYTQRLPFSKYNRLVPTSKPQLMYDPC